MPETLPQIPVALALGSNMDDRLDALRKAVNGLRPFMTIEKISPVYETQPAYATDQPIYLNAALIGITSLQPLALLWTLKDLESEIGRMPTFRFGPRVIDIDIIFYGDQTLHVPELTIPHARLEERDFVLRPLSDIAPGWRHPKSGLTVAEMLAEIHDEALPCLGDLL